MSQISSSSNLIETNSIIKNKLYTRHKNELSILFFGIARIVNINLICGSVNTYIRLYWGKVILDANFIYNANYTFIPFQIIYNRITNWSIFRFSLCKIQAHIMPLKDASILIIPPPYFIPFHFLYNLFNNI